MSDWKFSVNKLNQEKENLLKEINELTQIKIKLEQDIKSQISELDQYENESKIMDNQIRMQDNEITGYKKQINDLNNEINRLNNVIRNLKIEIENYSINNKLVVVKDINNNLYRNNFLCEFLKYYINKLLARHKMKMLMRLILKWKYAKWIEKNKKIEIPIKSTPITPQPHNRIKVIKKRDSVEEIPGKVSYKRRNEIKKLS